MIGLSVAERFAEAGATVRVLADEFAPKITSSVAPAIFFPYSIPPTNTVVDLAKRTFAHYKFLAMTLDGSELGLRKQYHYEVCSELSAAESNIIPFLPIFDDSTKLSSPEIPGGYPWGWRIETYFIDSRRFLPYLMRRMKELKVEVTSAKLTTLDEVRSLPEKVVVNCTGLGSRTLVSDSSVRPVKGQILYAAPPDERQLIQYSIIHDSFYAFPRTDDLVLGGTQEYDVFDLTPSDAVTERIIVGNRKILPDLDSTWITGVNTCLRPYREGGPRLERAMLRNKVVLHNYGHGGSGWTIARGCAEYLLTLL